MSLPTKHQLEIKAYKPKIFKPQYAGEHFFNDLNFQLKSANLKPIT